MTKVSIEHKINANEERFHRIGDFFEFTTKNANITGVLCQVGSMEVCVVTIDGFNRFKDPTTVKNPYKITDEELFEILGPYKHLRKISKVNISIEE